MVDEDIRTWWVPAGVDPGAWVAVDLGQVATVHAIQLDLADHDVARFAPPRAGTDDAAGSLRTLDPGPHRTEHTIEISADGVVWTTVRDTRGADEDHPHDLVVLDPPARVRHVRATGYAQPYGGYFAVSGLRVFGVGDGAPPAAVAPTAVRTDACTAAVHWPGSPGAQGHEVRYGASPTTLHHSWLVRETTEVTLTTLNAGRPCFVQVCAVNACGVTPGPVVPVGPEPV